MKSSLAAVGAVICLIAAPVQAVGKATDRLDEAWASLVEASNTFAPANATAGPVGNADLSRAGPYAPSAARGAFLSNPSDMSSFEFSAGSFDKRAERHSAGEAKEPSTAAAVIPEPSTYALMLAGLGLIGAAVRRRCLED